MEERPENIEPDALAEDEFSDYGSTSSETDSLTSSIHTRVHENGRRYSSYRVGQYQLPDDRKEQDRLDLHPDAERGFVSHTSHQSPENWNKYRYLGY